MGLGPQVFGLRRGGFRAGLQSLGDFAFGLGLVAQLPGQLSQGFRVRPQVLGLVAQGGGFVAQVLGRRGRCLGLVAQLGGFVALRFGLFLELLQLGGELWGLYVFGLEVDSGDVGYHAVVLGGLGVQQFLAAVRIRRRGLWDVGNQAFPQRSPKSRRGYQRRGDDHDDPKHQDLQRSHRQEPRQLDIHASILGRRA